MRFGTSIIPKFRLLRTRVTGTSSAPCMFIATEGHITRYNFFRVCLIKLCNMNLAGIITFERHPSAKVRVFITDYDIGCINLDKKQAEVKRVIIITINSLI